MRYGAAALSGGIFLYMLTRGPAVVREPIGIVISVVLLSSMFFGFYQAETRFCGVLGFLGMYTVDTTAVAVVEDTADRRLDRVTAVHEFIGALVLGLAGTLWVYVLSVLA